MTLHSQTGGGTTGYVAVLHPVVRLTPETFPFDYDAAEWVRSDRSMVHEPSGASFRIRDIHVDAVPDDRSVPDIYGVGASFETPGEPPLDGPALRRLCGHAIIGYLRMTGPWEPDPFDPPAFAPTDPALRLRHGDVGRG